MKKALIAGLIVVVVFAFGLPMYLGPDDISGCEAPTEDGRCQKVDVIVAVSGGDTEARTSEAINLYKNGWAGKLLFSGAAADKTGPSNAEVMRKMAERRGVDWGDIITEEQSETTAENAENTAALIRERGYGRIILVTSAYHQRRTSLEFNKVLGGEVQILNHPVKNDSQWSSWWWLTPYGWILGLGEIFKILIAGFARL